ncbi:hypothetical protein FRB98_009131 [Tulasnella sp. 332]|nr:hypothetical protein FRB98_009131 [Tulasnella sp. 332]
MQFNLYFNARAEELRRLLATHERTKLVVHAVGDRYTVDFEVVVYRMGEIIQENVIDPDVNNKAVASIIMMATLEAYFSCGVNLSCGLPKVTFVDGRDGWPRLLTEIEKLKTFEPETEYWYAFLRRVPSRFDAFDIPENSGTSGTASATTWAVVVDQLILLGGSLVSVYSPQKHTRGSSPEAVLDPQVDTKRILKEYVEVEVKLNDNGELFDTVMVAGLAGVGVSDSNVPETQETKDAFDIPQIHAVRKAVRE